MIISAIRILTKKNKFILFGLPLCIFLISILEILGIGLIFPIVAFIVEPESISLIKKYDNFNLLSNKTDVEIITLVLGITLLVFFCKGILNILVLKLQYNYIFNKLLELSSNLLRNYITKKYDFFLKRKISHLISNILVQVPEVIYNFFQPLMLLISEITLIILILIFLTFLNFKIILICAIFVLFAFVFYFFTSKKIERFGLLRIENEKQKTQWVQQPLHGIKETIVHNKKDFFYKKYLNHETKSINILKKYFLFLDLPKITLEFFAILTFITIIFVFRNSELKSLIPTIATFGFASYRILPSINRIINSLQRINFSTKALNEVIKDFSMSSLKNENKNKIKFKKNILLKNINFKYKNNFVLKNLNLRIKKNTFIGICGKSGSGKTTLANVLLGLLSPSKGNIFVDANKIDKNNLRNFQNILSYVPQNVFLFNGSIQENISMENKNENVDKKKLNNVIKLSKLNEFIKNLRGKYKSKIGEDGINISGGQKQRIGIARALYRSPDIIILDESTNSLDKKTENEIIKYLKKLSNTKTVILISHNTEAIKHCDEIYELKNLKLSKKSNNY